MRKDITFDNLIIHFKTEARQEAERARPRRQEAVSQAASFSFNKSNQASPDGV